MENYIERIYQDHVLSEVLTDAYHYTTPAAYFNEGRAQNDAVFYMFGRKEASGGGYTVASGLTGIIAVMNYWKKKGVPPEVLEFLKQQRLPSGARQYSDEYIEFLKNMKFDGVQIDAAPEGSVVFPQEPILRVRGPLAQVKMLESIALGIMNGQSAYATVAARLVEAAEKDFGNGSPKAPVSAQGLRRGPGIGAALESILALAIGGCSSTSTGTAARLLDMKFVGTMDHQWVMAHKFEYNPKGMTLAQMVELQEQIDKTDGKTEKKKLKRQLQKALSLDAFRSYAFTHRETGTFLLDTYNPAKLSPESPDGGLENAIKVLHEMKALGWGKKYSVRFDSGDLVKYSRLALRKFAEEGFFECLTPAEAKKLSDDELLQQCSLCSVGCAVADGLDEFSIQDMRSRGAWFTSLGVGTATTHPPALGWVYKMSSMFMDITDNQIVVRGDDELKHTMKVIATSPEKSSNPGLLNSERSFDEDGKLISATIFDEFEGLDVQGQVANLRNFDEVSTPKGVAKTKRLLVPVYDERGDLVYEFPKKTHPEGHDIIDVGAINRFVRENIETLSRGIRRIVKPRAELIAKALYQRAMNPKEGETDITMAEVMKQIEAKLPPEVERLPVFLDMNLLRNRRATEKEHLAHAEGLESHGVEAYEERFNGGNRTPDNQTNGELVAAGGKQLAIAKSA